MIQLSTDQKIGTIGKLLVHNKNIKSLQDTFFQKDKSGASFTKFIKRLFRTSLIGDILYKLGLEENIVITSGDKEIISALVESFIFSLRILYDDLCKYFRYRFNESVKLNFKEIEKKIREDNLKYPKLPENIKKHILRYSASGFMEIRGIRNSIKNSQNIEIFVQDKKCHVRYLNRKKIETRGLSNFIYNHTAFFYILIVEIIRAKNK